VIAAPKYREMGKEMLELYTEVKSVCTPTS